MLTVHPDTLQTETVTYTDRKGKTHSYERATIEVSIGTDRRRVRCWPHANGIDVFDLAVRFRTGTKVWPGSAVYWRESGEVNNLRPQIDKFNGQYCSLVGFFEDHAGSKHRSQHNAVA